MEQVAFLMIFLGMFTFIGFGFAVANSIEANENKIVANILGCISILGLFSCLAGCIIAIITEFL
ncbi:hypothetical protein RCZ02_16590 [Capnocytophaga felis]|uniref:hypothetical protein n=1 Tax=Capnocytophaga felis TaxID=2267611 RepID=UPI0012C54859|nr:hypothetical protein [Capnocytophaga felis]GET48828.1 hypothetical protein RCZ02_16590 [Capnocytophaga felis]